MNTLLNNKSELFKNAHKVTKVVLSFNPSANYQVTFGQVLKAMFAYNAESKASKLKSELFTNNRMPLPFKKTVAEITAKVYSTYNKFDVQCAAESVIKNIPQNVAKAEIVEKAAAAYYENKGVTMC